MLLRAPPITSTAIDYDQAVPASATALVFRPPIAEYAPPIDLDRESRQPTAFVGYEDGITESYLIQTEDRQVFGGGIYGVGGSGSSGSAYGGGYGRYERRAYIEKTGVLHR